MSEPISPIVGLLYLAIPALVVLRLIERRERANAQRAELTRQGVVIIQQKPRHGILRFLGWIIFWAFALIVLIFAA